MKIYDTHRIIYVLTRMVTRKTQILVGIRIRVARTN